MAHLWNKIIIGCFNRTTAQGIQVHMARNAVEAAEMYRTFKLFQLPAAVTISDELVSSNTPGSLLCLS